LAVVIQSRPAQDRDGAVDVVKKLRESRKKVVKIFADCRYTVQFINITKTKFKIELEIKKRDELPLVK